jgi:hypothetical protein
VVVLPPRTDGDAPEYVFFAVVNTVTLLEGLAVVAFVRHGPGQDDAFVLQISTATPIARGTVIRFLTYRRWVFLAVGASVTSASPR